MNFKINTHIFYFYIDNIKTTDLITFFPEIGRYSSLIKREMTLFLYD